MLEPFSGTRDIAITNWFYWRLPCPIAPVLCTPVYTTGLAYAEFCGETCPSSHEGWALGL